MANSRKITDRKKFVKELIKNGGNGTKAALAAGASPESAACLSTRYLKEPDVQAALANVRHEVEVKLDITVEKKMKVLWDIANPDNFEDAKHRDRISAIEVLNKMQGHNAADLVDMTSKGESISTVVMLPPNNRGNSK